MEVKDLLRKRRLELNLTMEQVGNFVGVSKSTVKKWESGYIANMRRDKIALLAQILELSPTDLLVDDNTLEPVENVPPSPLSCKSKDPRLNEITQIYHDMNSDGQELMLANARSLHAMGKYNAGIPASDGESAI